MASETRDEFLAKFTEKINKDDSSFFRVVSGDKEGILFEGFFDLSFSGILPVVAVVKALLPMVERMLIEGEEGVVGLFGADEKDLANEGVSLE